MENKELRFRSSTRTATHFKVDRSSIQNRLDNDIELDGWKFYTKRPLS